ncbi:unnamed protein product, partial [Owenia fusiformis]
RSKRSGRMRTINDIAKIPVDWPHFYVYRGADCKSATYDTLTVPEFSFGYMEIVNNTENGDIKLRMLEHFQQVMLHTMHYQWDDVRHCHGVILGKIEQGILTWSSDFGRYFDSFAKVSRIDQDNKLSKRTATAKPALGKTKSSDKIYICHAYNNGSCDQASDHNKGNLFLRHACRFCFGSSGHVNLHRHAESECKSKQSKLSQSNYN